jgi:formate hydrogenlyase subunit 3/multisubunit Na+/H+ antiporter MnhD subunit
MMRTGKRTLEVSYLALAIIGFLLPGVPMIYESIETGNILFWTQPARTTAELFTNRTSSAFALDLIAVVVTATVFMTIEARRIGMRGVWGFYLLLALFGLGGTLPLFLWARERRRNV